MNKISVFGGTGFIGSKFCSLYDSIVISRNDREPRSNNVLYFISTTSNSIILEDSSKDIQTNLILLSEVLDKCKNNKDIVFHYISSWYAIGKQDNLPVDEEVICNPKGIYSLTKHCAEQFIISFCELYGLKYKIFRLGNVFGEGDKDAGIKKNFLQYCINTLFNNNPIHLLWNGIFTRDYIYVDDVCHAIYHLINNGEYNQIYNIGNGSSVLMKDLIQYICYCLDVPFDDNLIKNKEHTHFEQWCGIKDIVLDIRKLINTGYNIDNHKNVYDYIKEVCVQRRH